MEIEMLKNCIVKHKIFGEGIVKNIVNSYLEVEFFEKGKISKFSYPSCFNGFLSLHDTSLQANVQQDVETWKNESGIEKKEKLRKQYEKTIKSIETRRLAAEDKKVNTARKVMEHRAFYNNIKQQNKKI